jgi:dipeptidyl aminopeptidase/acylaminoacyl peptidase
MQQMALPQIFFLAALAIGVANLFACGEANKESSMTKAPYGTWHSPVSAELTAGSTNGVMGLQVDGDDLYWWESRPLEGGRYVVMKHDATRGPVELTPAAFNVRTRVHEYGGASFLVVDGTLYFSNFADQALYRQNRNGQPNKLTVSEGLRYADCAHDARHERLLCVREDHRQDGEAVNAIVAVNLSGEPNDGEVLWQQSDFVGYPRINVQGTKVAWISWDHPNMPWDNVSLWMADVDATGQLSDARCLNQNVNESILQPAWAGDGTLYFLSDRSGWWNMHRFNAMNADGIAPVHKLDAELGGPLWALGIDYYELLSNEEALVQTNNSQGTGLGILHLKSGALRHLDLSYVAYSSPVAQGGMAYFLGGTSDGPTEIVAYDLARNVASVLHESGDRVVAPEYLSYAESITFPTAGGGSAYGYYYPPKNGDYQAPSGELPPLLVLMHGGPTGATSPQFSIAKQYWTSRGIAIVDVNYRGSTGYGRAYRQELNGQWGIVDLEDAVAATQYLVGQGKADPERLLIRGGSAGGFTTLSALAFTDVFAAGANYYGVSDLTALAEHTHKFESRYLDSMVGPYPEAADVYAARSPINALDGFNSPLITFQGLEDKVVPPAQSEMIDEAVKAKGTPTAYVPFAGEQHGFRRAENNIIALESELYFYGKVLGFKPAGDLREVAIDNLIE